MKSPKNPNTHSNPVSIRTAEEFRAIAMVPPPEHEPPLSLEELAPKFGGSVILDGVDFSELTAIYSAAVHGTEFQQLAEWQSKPLREFEIREFQGAIRLDHRLLVWHDTQAHKTDGYKSFEKWLNKLHGCKMSRTTDEIVHARRPGCKGLSRFVKGRKAKPCDSVFVVIKKIGEHRYQLIDGFVGPMAELEPWDENATALTSDPAVARQRSQSFWNHHAFIYDESFIVPGTEVTQGA